MRKNPQPHSFVDTQVKPGSIAEKVGLKVKDSLVKIGNDCALDYTIEEALESLKRGKDFFDMIVERWVFLQLFFVFWSQWFSTLCQHQFFVPLKYACKNRYCVAEHKKVGLELFFYPDE